MSATTDSHGQRWPTTTTGAGTHTDLPSSTQLADSNSSYPATPAHYDVHGRNASTSDTPVKVAAANDSTAMSDASDPMTDDTAVDLSEQGSTSKPVKLTVHAALDRIGFGWFQIFLLQICGLCWSSDAVEIQLLGLITPILAEEYNLDTNLQAGLQGMVFAGMVCGSLFWGPFADRFGRKPAFGGCSLFITVFGFVTAFMPNWWSFLIMRFFTGIGVAGLCISFNLLLEFLPAKARGQWLNWIELYFTAGSLFTTGIAWAILPTASQNFGWRLLTGVVAIVPLICVLSYPLIPESPSWLITSGREDEARATIERAARWNGTRSKLPEHWRVIANDGKSSNDDDNVGASSDGTIAADMDTHNAADASTHASAIESAANTSNTSGWGSKMGDIRNLFGPTLWLNTSLLWLIWFCDSIAYYGIIFVTANLLAATDSTELVVNTYVETFITACGEIAGIIYVSFVINTLGRRKSIFTCFVIFIVFQALCAMPVSKAMNGGGQQIDTLIYILIARGWIFSGWSALFIYSPETYPTSLRSTGLSLCSGVARVAGAITPFIANTGYAASPYVPIGVYAGVAAVGAIATLFLPYETMGKELSDSVEHGYEGTEESISFFGRKVPTAKHVLNKQHNTGALPSKDVDASDVGYTKRMRDNESGVSTVNNTPSPSHKRQQSEVEMI